MEKRIKMPKGFLQEQQNTLLKKFGVTVEREQGEKYADYLKRISDLSMKSKLDAFSQRETELENKIKKFQRW